MSEFLRGKRLRVRTCVARSILSRLSRRREFPQIVAAALILGLLVPVVVDAAIGRLPGQFQITDRGAATYQIPLSVPAGRNGLAPQIALSYNSQAGDGSAGTGWTLTGFSRIERCGKTFPLDGQRTAVTFSNADRFCLDGRPLLRISAGTCGADTVEFRTEIDVNEKVTCHGSLHGGPEYFRVQYPSGLSAYLGRTANARRVVTAGGAGSVIQSWLVSQVQDKFHNSMRFTYLNSGAAEVLPDQVTWTDHCASAGCSSGSGSQYELKLEYEDRDDIDFRAGYLSGAMWERQKRLQKMTFKAAGSTVQQYLLSYAQLSESGASRRSKLTGIEHCGASTSDCLPMTSVDWTLGSTGWGADSAASPSLTNPDKAVFADWDGDGRMDFYIRHNNVWHIGRAHNGDYSQALVSSGHAYNTAMYPQLGWEGRALNANGDGRTDLLALGANDLWTIYLANDSAGGLVAHSTGWNRNDVPNPTVVDMDGDGLDDIVYMRGASGLVDMLLIRRNLGPHSTTGAPQFAAEVAVSLQFEGMDFPHSHQLRRVDFNGDGRGDLLVSWTTTFPLNGGGVSLPLQRYQVLISTGTTFEADAAFSLPLPLDVILPLDVNGDGLTDLFVHEVDPAQQVAHVPKIFLSTGVGFSAVETGFPAAVMLNPQETYRAVDANGDGRADLLWGQLSSSKVYLSDGTFGAFGNDPNLVLNLPDVTADALNKGTVADIDGDGLPDLVLLKNQKFVVKKLQGVRGDLLAEITDGLDVNHAIEYASLSALADGGVYLVDPEVGQPASTLPEPAWSNSTSRGISPFAFVERYTTDDGDGGTYTVDYQYWNARQNSLGRGFLGFAQVLVTDDRLGAPKMRTTFYQGFPFIGRPLFQHQLKPDSTSALLSESLSLWQAVNLNSSQETAPRKFVHLSSRSDKGYELNGSVSRLTTTSHSYTNPASGTPDYSHGRPFSETVEVSVPGQSNAWTSTRNFVFDESARTIGHCLGLPTRIDEVGTRGSDQVTDQRSQWATYAASNCGLTSEKVGSPTDTAKQRRTAYTRDNYGNVVKAVTNAANVVDGSDRDTRYEYALGGGDAWAGYRLVTPSFLYSEENFT